MAWTGWHVVFAKGFCSSGWYFQFSCRYLIIIILQASTCKQVHSFHVTISVGRQHSFADMLEKLMPLALTQLGDSRVKWVWLSCKDCFLKFCQKRWLKYYFLDFVKVSHLATLIWLEWLSWITKMRIMRRKSKDCWGGIYLLDSLRFHVNTFANPFH